MLSVAQQSGPPRTSLTATKRTKKKLKLRRTKQCTPTSWMECECDFHALYVARMTAPPPWWSKNTSLSAKQHVSTRLTELVSRATWHFINGRRNRSHPSRQKHHPTAHTYGQREPSLSLFSLTRGTKFNETLEWETRERKGLVQLLLTQVTSSRISLCLSCFVTLFIKTTASFFFFFWFDLCTVSVNC